MAKPARAVDIVGRKQMHRYGQHDRQHGSNDAGSSPTDAIAHFALAHEMSEVRPASA
jgi:hypothetical protein